MTSSLLDAFLGQIASRPSATAISFEPQPGGDLVRLSWAELGSLVGHQSAQLQLLFERHPALPRCVGYRCDNSIADLVVALTCMNVGAIEVPIDGRVGPSRMETLWHQVGGHWIDDDSRAELSAVAAKLRQPAVDGLARLRRQRTAIQLDSPALILWTSGTTDMPKGVVLSHRNLLGNAAAKLAHVPQAINDVRLTALSLAHAYARTCDLGTWLLSGCQLALTSGTDGFIRMAPAVRPTLANTVPVLASRLLSLDAGESGLDRMKLLGCGGAAMDDASFQAWRQRGVVAIQGYGLTEAAPVICSATPDDARAGWVGRLVPGWQAKIIASRLHVRGPHRMLGYWDDPTATADKIDADGWLDTGDLVEQDPSSGQFRILGRADDVIVLENGYKLHPGALERMVQRLSWVRHAMVSNMPDGIWLWLDADEAEMTAEENATQLNDVLQSCSPWERPCRVARFTTPLTYDAGELTSKGTICRSRIRDQRFSAVTRETM